MVARYRKKKITWGKSEIVSREGERVVPFYSSVHTQGPKVQLGHIK
jgi:hypothetical protein